MANVTARQHTRALLMLILATSFWGLSFPLIKALGLTQQRVVPESTSAFVTAWALAPRFILGAIFFLCTQWKAIGTLTKTEWKQGLSLGLFATAGMLFQTDGLMRTAASTSAFLTQLYAILIPIYLGWRAKKMPPWTVWVSSVLVLVGVSVLGKFDWHALRFGRGEAETLIASCFFMGQILSLEVGAWRNNRVMPVTALMFFIQAIVFLVLALSVAPRLADLVLPLTSGAWDAITLVLSSLSTVAALIIMNTYQPWITATEAGLIYCVEPIFGSIFALFLPVWLSRFASVGYENEVTTKALLIGGGLITAANILIQLKPLPRDEL
jgi:drug/metabolite transporter (DMT)-like permease